jgi:hypothetical protein
VRRDEGTWAGMSEAETDLERPVGGRLGLVLVGAAALAGLVQGLGSILWNSFALPPPPPAPAVDVNPLLREAPLAPKPAAPAEAANAASAEANKAAEPEPAPKNQAEAEAPKLPGSSVPPYGPPANVTNGAAPVVPVQPAPATPTTPEPAPEDQPPL